MAKPGKSDNSEKAGLEDWLFDYAGNLLDSLKDKLLPQFLPKDLTARLETLFQGDDGTLTPIPELVPAPARLDATSRNTVLLGQAGTGKSWQLRHNAFQPAENLFNTVKQQGLTTSTALPILMDVAELGQYAVSWHEKPRNKRNANLFADFLEYSLSKITPKTVPLSGLVDNLVSKISAKTVPAGLTDNLPLLVLMDNLESMDAALANLFFSHMQQWQAKTTSKIIIGCQQAKFSIYQPWFKPEQGWDTLGITGFNWAEMRASLAESWSAADLDELENHNISQLFTHPASANLLFKGAAEMGATAGKTSTAIARTMLGLKQSGKLDENLLWHLASAGGGGLVARSSKGSNGVTLPRLEVALAHQLGTPLVSHYSQQSRVPLTGDTSQAEQRVIELGLAERHPVTGKVELLAGLEKIAAAWALLADPNPTKISELAQQPQNYDLLATLYWLTAPPAKANLLQKLCGRCPRPAICPLLLKLASQPPNTSDFEADWLIYLDNNLDSFHASPPELATFCTALANSGEALAKLALTTLDFMVAHELGSPEIGLERSRLMERLGNPAEARTALQSLSASSSLPGVEATLRMATLHQQENDHASANELLTGLDTLLSGYAAQTASQLSVARRNLGELDAAISSARRAVGLGKLPEYRLNLARALRRRGDLTESEQELVQLVGEFSTYADGYFELGEVLILNGALDNALANFRRAVELEPEKGRFLLAYSRALIQEGRWSEAAGYLKAITPLEGDVARLLGLVLLKLNDLLQAESYLRRAPDSREIAVFLAAVAYQRGDYSQAIMEINRAVGLEETSEMRLNALSALIAEAQRDAATAITNWQRVSAVPGLPTEWQLARELGMARLMRTGGKFAQANQFLQAARRLATSNPQIMLEAGNLALAMDNPTRAAEYFEQGLATIAGQTVTATEPGANWLDLFSPPEELAFELPFKQAIALSASGKGEAAREIWHKLLHDQTEQRQERQAAVYHQIGLSLLDSNLPEAITNLTLAITTSPARALYHLGLAQGWRKAGEVAKAEKELAQARQLDPALAEVYALQATLELDSLSWLASGDNSKLLGVLTRYIRALEYAPVNAEYLYQAGLLAFHLGHANQAGQYIERLVKLETPHLPGLALLACHYERLDDPSAGRAVLEPALTELESPLPAYLRLVAARLARLTGDDQGSAAHLVNSPADTESVGLRAIWQYEQGLLKLNAEPAVASQKLGEAVTLWQSHIAQNRGLKLDEFYLFSKVRYGSPHRAEPEREATDIEATLRLALAQALVNEGKPGEAQLEITAALQLQPDLVAGYQLRGNLALNAGRKRDAIEAYEQAVQLLPQPVLYALLGGLYYEEQQYSDATAILEKLASQRAYTSQPDYYLQLGGAYSALGKWEQARVTYEKGLNALPAHPRINFVLSVALRQLKNPAAAISPLQEAVSREPQNVQYLSELAETYEAVGGAEEAAEAYHKLLAIEPERADFWLRSGKNWLKLRQRVAARQALQEALNRQPNLPEAQFEMGKFYLENIQPDQLAPLYPPAELEGMLALAVAEG